MIAAIIWFVFLIFLISIISIRLFSEIFESQNKKRKSKINNPFANNQAQEKKVSSTELLELEYGSSLPLIALATSVMLWGMLYFLQKEFNNMLVSLQNYKGLTIPLFIILFVFLGIGFMRKLLNDIGQENEFHDSKNITIVYQRAKAAVNTYLSFLLGALVFTFLSDISFDFSLIRFAPMSFIIGSSFYLLLRQNPNQQKIMSLFLAAMRNQKVDNNSSSDTKEDSSKINLDL
jgi:hypothetical protein